MSYEVD